MPKRLTVIPDPPRELWAIGSLPERAGVAIVGTRRATTYGRRVARSLGEAVGRWGWPVISGLARGVDAASHQGSVAVNAVGVAVLGSAVDVIYPAENRELAAQLVATGGAIISEYPPGTPPAPFRFPARNRLISGLSGAVIVVEAGVTGGALITARLALEQGIEVMAVPGDIDRPSSMGCNLLIRDGAHPVLGPEDLLPTLEMILGPAPQPSTPPPLPEERSWDDLMASTTRPVSEVLADAVRAQLDSTPHRKKD
ncbi:MAG TPA: DNA-processing protein DprA [Acidimicrobiia bacterium]|nr:DNA-processing protein DprA [Acidimicrobiia bacterium]